MRTAIALLGVCLAAGAQDHSFFENRVRPVLARSCYGCHGAETQFGGLRVDSREALLRGGKRGPAIVVGDARESLLVRAVRHETLAMPVGGKLAENEIAAIAEWVERGAAWPVTPELSRGESRYRQLVREHWAFQPVKPVQPPGPGHPVDAFLGVKPAAGRDVLRRRLHYVLTGLPPEPADLKRAESYEESVERLLNSPHYGEQWARRWMDIVRFAETRGYEWNYEIAGAWRYRDYLIRAFNADLPYDQFIREQIAGDLLPQPRRNAAEGINESVIGTAFYRLGEAGHDDCIQFREIALDVIDNQIDTLTKGFLGLTVACARCHDHKLDPIPTKDYYGLYGILNSSRPVVRPIDDAEARRPLLDRLRELRGRLRQQVAQRWKAERPQLVKRLRGRSFAASAEMADPETLWATLEKEGAAGWARYEAEAARRKAQFEKDYEQFDSGWKGDEAGFAPSAAGEFVLAREGEGLIAAVLPRGVYSGLITPRVQGAWRSPDLPKHRKYASVRSFGGALAARRTVIDNCAIGEQNKLLEGRWPAWQKLETYAAEARLPVFVELVTRWANPRYPDRPGVLKPEQEKLLGAAESYFGWAGAVLHDGEESPAEDLGHVLRLKGAQGLDTVEGRAAAFAEAIGEAVERWAAGRADDEDARWLDWAVRVGLLENRVAALEEARVLLAEYRQVEAELGTARMIEGLADAGPGRDFPVLIAGGAKSFGEPAPRRLLSEVLGDAPLSGGGSGRLGLAERIADPRNPLTARVMVNRIWQAVFGEGLVRSVDNFGTLGDQPEHPELLDHLADRFVREGWSVKQMMRLLVTSAKFREAGRAPRRLSAEEIRDTMLASAGELKRELYGESISPYRTAPEAYRKLHAGPLDGGGKRSLYTKITRMEGPAFLETFDYPAPLAGRGSRDVTNVPAQALTLLNDPFVVEMARRWGEKLAVDGRTPEERIDGMFRQALGRGATAVEQARLRGLAAELASLHQADMVSSAVVWKDVAHAVFNLKEFLYVP